MDVMWTEPREIVSRIDAEFFRAEFVEAAHRLGAHVFTESFRTLWAESNRIYIGIAGFENVVDQSLYTPYLRPVDITDDGQIDYDNLPWCKREWLDDHEKKGCAKPGDLIIEVKGNTRRVAVVSERIPPRCIVSGSSYRIQLKRGYDPHFIQAFLLSSIGQQLKRRLTSNTTISYIDPESFREYRVPRPDDQVQLAVGNTVRKAERLRLLAGHNLQSVRHAMDSLYGPTEMNEGASSGWLNCVHLSPTRLDSWFNQPRNVRLGAQLVARRDLTTLRTFCRQSTKQVKWEDWPSEMFAYFEIGGIDSHPGQISSQPVRVSAAPSRAKFVVRPWDVLVSTVRPNLKSIAFVPEGAELAVCSSGFSVLRSESPEIAGYIWACLVHDVATQQLMRWNTGGTYPAIERSVPLEVYVPAPGDQQMNELGSLVVNATRWNRESRTLIDNAKADIEALIDGTLDETQLLAKGEEAAAWLAANPLPESERISV